MIEKRKSIFMLDSCNQGIEHQPNKQRWLHVRDAGVVGEAAGRGTPNRCSAAFQARRCEYSSA